MDDKLNNSVDAPNDNNGGEDQYNSDKMINRKKFLKMSLKALTASSLGLSTFVLTSQTKRNTCGLCIVGSDACCDHCQQCDCETQNTCNCDGCTNCDCETQNTCNCDGCTNCDCEGCTNCDEDYCTTWDHGPCCDISHYYDDCPCDVWNDCNCDHDIPNCPCYTTYDYSCPNDTPPPTPEPTPEPLVYLNQYGEAQCEGTGQDGEFGADPVNMYSGNYLMIIPDFSIPGRGLNLDFIRTYNSRMDYNGPLGHGWTHNYNHRIYFKNRHVHYIGPDGSIKEFGADGKGGFISPTGFDGQLISTTSNLIIVRNNQVKYIFTKQGQLVSIKDTNNNTITLNYDRGRLISITDTVGRSIIIEHESTAVGAKISKIILPDGSYFEYNYIADRLTSVIGSDGYRASYEYDANHNMTYKDDLKMPARYAETYFDYDELNRAVRMYNANRQLENEMFYESQRTVLRDAKGNDVTYEFNAEGKMTSYTDQSGNTTRYEYGGIGNLTQVTTPTNKVYNYVYEGYSLKQSTNPAGQATTYEYNSFNKVTKITTAAGIIATLTYDTGGNLTEIKDALNNFTAMEYNLGRISSITDAEGKKTQYKYDNHSNIKNIILPNGDKYNMNYDEVGKPVLIITPDGKESRITYRNGKLDKLIAPDGTYTKYKYNTKGMLQSIMGPDGKQTTYQYNDLNEIIKTILPDKTAIGFNYDPNGNLQTITDRGGKQITHQYNANNQIEQITNYRNLVNSYIYNHDGAIKQIIQPNGQSLSYNYDNAGRLANINNDLTLQYDNVNRITNISSLDSNYAITYNTKGEITDFIDNDRNKTIKHQYLKNGLPLNMQVMETNSTAYYKLNYTYDDNNRLNKLNLWATPLIKNTAYNKAGQIVQVNLGNKTRKELTYDKLTGNITSIRTLKGNVPTAPGIIREFIIRAMKVKQLNNIKLKYDDAGKIIEEQINGEKKQYRYNQLNELIEVRTNGQITEQYSYNKDGNRISKTINGVKTTYTHNDDNQLIQEETNGAITNYTYDHNGNMQTKSNGTDSYYYLYDEYNRLTEVRKNGVTIQTNVYDAFGRRIKKITQKGTRQYFYNGNSVALEITEDNKTIRHFGAAFQINGDRFFGIHDIRGSLIAIMNNVGTIVREISYDAYGNILSDSNANFDYDYLFCGCEHDHETELFHMGARYYDPNTSRFTSCDPIGAVASGSINLYQYCSNDPVNYIDPDGLFRWGDLGWGTLNLVIGISEAVVGFSAATAGGVTVAGFIVGAYMMTDGIVRAMSGVMQIAHAFSPYDDEYALPGNLLGGVGMLIDLATDDDFSYNSAGPAQKWMELGGDVLTIASSSASVLKTAKVLKTANVIKTTTAIKTSKDLYDIINSSSNIYNSLSATTLTDFQEKIKIGNNNESIPFQY